MTVNKKYRYTVRGFDQPWTLIASRHGMSQLIYPPHLASLAGLEQAITHNEGQIEDRGLFVEFGIIDLLEQYFAGRPVSFEGVPLDLEGTPFQQSVWMALSQIPHGETWTYTQLANTIGKPSAVRAVGTAVGRNLLPIILPCHRVVGSNGTLTGFRGGLQMKKELLALEGITHMEAVGHQRFRF
ncbi:methylated-DNA--[protein]-cysteine S-methyltransferase [Paenibacillus oenotherae]|uniref:Methylated-DNA--[protein]-cysteine S-methyltransferase n=1 Tax=Paenibacillus oenotherae TaxID=1435645 RepID=A0ABS7D4I9_9BACL|nr:methylated-DNA--[protein]-cysteine S-methyltransferase [Paenibacillus oenotherae]MBW7474789.1 methylated-DNA--[protein]-cysteine S-methyltransferase [Paenibacillus oenotherae]